MINAAVLKAMAEAGCTPEQMVAVVQAYERAEHEALAAKREQARIRQQRRRERHATSRNVTRDACDAPLDKETSPTPPKETNPPKENPPKGGQKKGPKAILETVLSSDQAEAVVAHRQRLRKPLTDRAAELLAAKFERTAEVGWTADQAADALIERGWQGLELDWLKNMTPPAARTKPDAEVSERRWEVRLSIAREQRQWSSHEWGPMPGQSGCRCPPHLIKASDGEGWEEAKKEKAA